MRLLSAISQRRRGRVASRCELSKRERMEPLRGVDCLQRPPRRPRRPEIVTLRSNESIEAAGEAQRRVNARNLRLTKKAGWGCSDGLSG